MAQTERSTRGLSPWRDFLNLDPFFGNRESNLPAVNISEDEKSYSLEIVAPGFKKEDFRLKVEDDILTISAETRSERKEENGREYTRREYSYSSFTRSFNLPDNVKDDKITAVYQEGILRLELPKSKGQVKASKDIPIS